MGLASRMSKSNDKHKTSTIPTSTNNDGAYFIALLIATILVIILRWM